MVLSWGGLKVIKDIIKNIYMVETLQDERLPRALNINYYSGGLKKYETYVGNQN